MLSAISAIGTVLGIVTNREFRDWFQTTSEKLLTSPKADFMKRPIYFDDLHLNEVVSTCEGEVLSKVKIGTFNLPVIFTDIHQDTINNRFPTGKDQKGPKQSIVSFLIDETLRYVNDPSSNPNSRLEYVKYVKDQLLKHLTKKDFKFKLTKSEIEKIHRISELNTEKILLLKSENYEEITIEAISNESSTRILNSDRFKRIFQALNSTDFEKSEMPLVFRDTDVFGAGGTPLNQYFSTLDVDCINNKFEFGSLLTSLLRTVKGCFPIDKLPSAHKAENAVSIVQSLLTILVDKGILISESDKKVLEEINQRLAKYIEPKLFLHLNRTPKIDASVANMQPAAKKSSSTSSSAGSAAVDQAQDDQAAQLADQNRLLAIAGVPYVDPQAKASTSTAPAATTQPVDPNLAAKVELTVSQLRAMATDTPAQQPANAQTYAATVAQKPQGKGGKAQTGGRQ